MPEDQDVLNEQDDFEDEQDESLEEEAPQAKPRDDQAAYIERLKREKREAVAELKTYRKREREALLARYPELSEDDISGLSPARVEALAAKLRAQQAAPEQPKTEGWDRYEAIQQASSSGGAQDKVTSVEAHRKYTSGEWTHEEYMQALTSGRVDLKL